MLKIKKEVESLFLSEQEIVDLDVICFKVTNILIINIRLYFNVYNNEILNKVKKIKEKIFDLNNEIFCIIFFYLKPNNTLISII